MFNLIRNCQTIFQRGTIMQSHYQYMSSSFSILSPAFGIVGHFNFSHSSGDIVVSHCDFNLPFAGD